MRIAGISHVLPSRVITNDEVLDLVRTHSRDTFEGDLESTVRRIGFWLEHSGSSERRWSTPDERPIDLLVQAGRTALADASMSPEDVDLVVYTGVGRGFLEPGGSYHAAAALGATRAQCFDTLDACMSWTRTLQVVRGLFATGAVRTALVVNAEFNLRDTGPIFPDLFALKSPESITWTFPAFTLGEAATATVLTADEHEPWDFEFASRPDLAELCNIPLGGYADFCMPSPKVATNGTDRFVSYGFELHKYGREEALGVYERLKAPKDEAVAMFTHASSQRWWQGLADEVGAGERIFHVFGETGNIVSASVPTAISTAVEQGRLRRGDRAIGWIGSAGMSFSAYSFIY